jgi:hypothetical protein
VRNCLTDEGRPFGIGLQERVPNHLRRLWLSATVVCAEGKGLAMTRSGVRQEEDCKGREGIALAKAEGKYKGRKRPPPDQQITVACLEKRLSPSISCDGFFRYITGLLCPHFNPRAKYLDGRSKFELQSLDDVGPVCASLIVSFQFCNIDRHHPWRHLSLHMPSPIAPLLPAKICGNDSDQRCCGNRVCKLFGGQYTLEWLGHGLDSI